MPRKLHILRVWLQMWSERARGMLNCSWATRYFDEGEIMTLSPFDILKRHDDGSFIWLEAAQDLQAAQARLQELGAKAPGDYFVFDQKSQQIIARLSTGTVAN
jgi:hypothetical protein